MSFKRLIVGLSIIPALVAGMMPLSASAQTQAPEEPRQIPAVQVNPVGTTREDPNGGQWFITEMDFGETKKLQARLFNPAEVPQTVKLYLADLRFDEAGVPEVTNVPEEVGTWGEFERPEITMKPKESVVQTFTLTAPDKDDRLADPGDHVGAVVVEQQPQGVGLIRSVKRLAVRLYITLPGDARKQFEIRGVTNEKDSFFFTRELSLTVHLKNTGRVRLDPTVKVDDAKASGASPLMSNTIERYVVTRPVKFWGGPMRLRIDATTRTFTGEEGPARQMRVTVWVIPWHLFLLIAMFVGAFFGIRRLLRRRGKKYEAMQADLARIERLVAKQQAVEPVGEVVGPSADAQAAILAAVKQAKRSGDFETAERLEALLVPRAVAPDGTAKSKGKSKPPPPRKPKTAQKRRPTSKRPGS